MGHFRHVGRGFRHLGVSFNRRPFPHTSFRRDKKSTTRIITGFIGSTENGETTTFGRSGSDYTASIFGAALNVNEIEASVSSTLWWKLREIIEKKADDEGQRLWANAYLQQLYDAKRKGDCFPISFPLYSRTSPQQRRALLSQNTQQQSSEALTYILTHNGKRSVVDRMQAPEAWSQVADKLRQDYGAEADLINSGETAEDKNKQCEVVVRTFEYILSLPQEQQGPVIRWFLDKHISVGIF